MAEIVIQTVYNSATYGLYLNIHGNGGSAPSSVSAYKTSNAASVNVSKAIPSATPTRSGYAFLGYALGSASNAVSKQPGDTLSYTFSRQTTTYTTSTRVVDGVTYKTTTYNCRDQAYEYELYAKWQALTYAVTFNANGGVGAPASQAKTNGEPLTLTSSIPTRDGYVFKGWATSPSGTAAYQPGDSYTTDADITLYAVWEQAGSTLDSVTSSVEIGSSGSASWTIIDPAFTHKLVLSCGDAPAVEVTKAAGVSSASFTIPNTWLAAITNAQAATATATLITYDNGVDKGSSSMPFTVTVPNSVVPTITAFTASHYSANATVDGWDTFTQGYSQADLSVTATPGTGASITSVSFSGPEVNQVGDLLSVRTGVLNTPGAKTFTVTVTDSRGRSATDTVSVTVYPYAAPTVISIGTMRADADGTTNNSAGAYLKVQPVYSLSSVNGENSFTAQTLSYADHGSGTPTATINCVSGTTYGPPGNMWAINQADAYDVTVSVTDALGNTATATVTLPATNGIWYGKANDRLGLGEAPDGTGLWSSWDAHFKKTVDVIPRRVSKQLTSSGWFRVLEYAPGNQAEALGAVGFVIDLTIGKDGIGAEAHKVSLLGVYGKVGFENESGVSQTQQIDKVRYCYETSSPYNAYVDIHLSANPQSVVSVDFVVSTKPGYQGMFNALALDSVSNTPSGETVLASYNFGEMSGSNTDGRYYRFDSGLQVCYKTVTFNSVNINSAWGSLYETAALDLGNWPVAFLEKPAVTIGQDYDQSSGAGMVEAIKETSATACGKIWACRPTASTNYNLTYWVVGVGRWK